MGSYNIILADPPWWYRNVHTGGSMKSGSAYKYPTMTADELCSLPIKNITDKNAILFLWATVPQLPEGLQVMKAWGFSYKTMLTWLKEGRKGLGFWFRGETEHLLLGIRGRIKAFRFNHRNYISHPVLKHSEKPEVFRRFIEESTKGILNPRRLELFARIKSPGWDSLGYGIDGQEVRAKLAELVQS